MPVSAEFEEENSEGIQGQSMNNADQDTVNYKQKYKILKKKLRILVHEQECFMEELRKAQRKLLKVSRDRSFLLDRLLQYEKVEDSSSDSDATASSDSEGGTKKSSKKKKMVQQSLNLFPDQSPGMIPTLDMPAQQSLYMTAGGGGSSSFPLSNFLSQTAAAHNMSRLKNSTGEPVRKKMKGGKKTSKPTSLLSKTSAMKMDLGDQEGMSGQLSREEVEKKLAESASKPSYMRIDKAPTSVPLDIFSNEDSNPDSENVEVDNDLVIDLPPGE